jgi:hypothetical protein
MPAFRKPSPAAYFALLDSNNPHEAMLHVLRVICSSRRAHPRVCRWSPLPPGRPRTLPTSRVQESLVPCRCAPSPLASVF